MSANIENRNGVYSFIENGRKEIAWHGLGESVEHALTAKEAIEGCHADFEVGLQPVLGVTPQLEEMIENGQFINASMLKDMIIKGKKSTMRLDYNETMGVVSDSYGVVQYADAFKFVDLLTTGELGGATPTFETAGLLGNGERCFITAKFPEPIRLNGKDDVIDMYCLFTTSHDGSGAVTCMMTPVRVVCNNTLQFALSKHDTGRISFRHTRYVNNRLDLTNKDNADMAYRTLGLYNTYKEHYEQKLAELAKIRLTDKQSEDILAKTLLSSDGYKAYKEGGINSEDIPTRGKNILFNVMDALNNGVGQESLEGGTGLWLMNGLTTYYQNNFTWKDDEKKFSAITEGSVADKVQTAYDLLMVA